MPATPDLTQIEKDKLEIDPNFDFRDIAQRPFEDITTNEIGMFKWSGVYHQLQKGFFYDKAAPSWWSDELGSINPCR